MPAALSSHTTSAAPRRVLEGEKAQAFSLMASQARFVAHALGNPLTGLSLTLELLQATPLNETQARLLSRSMRVVERLCHYKEALGGLGGASKEQGGYFEAMSSVDAAIAKLCLDDAYVVHATVSPKAQQIWGQQPLIEQALEYLLRNAVDAMPNGGELGIEIKSRADSFELVVWDSGPGIADDMAKKIWHEPTTHKPHQGGMGLMWVALIVEKLHDGHVAYERRRPHGARFIITLPKPSAAARGSCEARLG